MNPIELLKQHEGFKSKVYTCPAGKRTIGYGYNLDANPLKFSSDTIKQLEKEGISRKAAELLLIDQVDLISEVLLAKFSWWHRIGNSRQSVLIDMAYNLGINGLLKFKNTLTLIGKGDYRAAADEMLNSDWAKQVKTRAQTLSTMMKYGD